MNAAHYAAEIHPRAPQIAVEVVDGLDHSEMVTEPVAHERIEDWLLRLSPGPLRG